MTAENSHSSKHEDFVALYVRHEPAVFSFVLAMIGRSADAEDITQRASMTMWRCFEKYKPGTNFKNWAFQIAKNEALNYLTKAKRDRHVFSEKLVELLAKDTLEETDKLEARRRALDMCVKKLPPEDNEIVSGCYAEGVTVRSYAKEKGGSANKFYKKLNRIRGKLQQCIERQLGLEDFVIE